MEKQMWLWTGRTSLRSVRIEDDGTYEQVIDAEGAGGGPGTGGRSCAFP